MTERFAEKHAAREYARDNGVSYRSALGAVRLRRRTDPTPFAEQVLIEAVEGCGIRHWARIDAWNGRDSAVLSDIGGEQYVLTVADLIPVVRSLIDSAAVSEPLDVDSYDADEIIQSMLFGCVIYRHQVRRRPAMVA
ncbi:hypothetical protein CYJ73_16765 [Gordonia terrae]|uniref:Uncharacterized protein n=1 Tax=Gordonia terrae TaxID=2055 RepID=A0A2I1R5Z4_9ACTN|nr:hypothetical protein [Gordonia terrae]PKZ64546.1 hypothetical protein CYJ73_16765 [Gordonia terrae]